MLDVNMRSSMVQKVFILILLCIVATIVPGKVRKRLVVLAKTPLVQPMEKVLVHPEPHYRKYEKFINEAALEYNISPSLIAAVIKVESNFNPYAVSGEGAMGLMQITPDTWAYLGGVGSPYNAGLNIKLGSKYLRGLLDQFQGDIVLSLAAYNAGPGNVKKYKSVPPFRETRQYVPKVLALFKKYLTVSKVG